MKILTHNVFWFQGTPFESSSPGQPDRDIVKALCVIYKEINPDVICLQEVQSRSSLEMVSECLGMKGHFSPGMAHSQYGGAVLWRPGRGVLVRESTKSSIPVQRMWQIVEIESACGVLRIANVHLPSGRQMGAEKAQAQRIAEMQHLTTCLDSPLDIIAGDFNELPGGSLGEYLHNQGYVDTAVYSGNTDLATYLDDGRIDYLWIAKRMQSRLRTYTVMARQRLVCANTGKTHISDHQPLWIKLEPGDRTHTRHSS